MCIRDRYLSAVSTMIIFGQNQKATMFNYYYYSGSTFTTNAPTGIIAVLKSSGNVTATLTGYQVSLSTDSVEFLFYDTTNNTYSFDEVDIYTQNNGTLQYLVSKNTGLNYSKSQTEAVTVYFTLTLENTPSLYINYSFLYLLVPELILQKVFPFSNYPGITSFTVSGVNGTASLVGTGLIINGFSIILQLNTTGNGTPIITALTLSAPTTRLTIANSNYVFSATLNVKLPSTSNQVTYPIIIGLTYEVQ